MPCPSRCLTISAVTLFLFSQLVLFNFFWFYNWCDQVLGYMLSVLYQVLFFLLVSSYFLAIVTPPGTPEGEQSVTATDLANIQQKAILVKRIKKSIKKGETIDELNYVQLLQQVSFCFSCKRVKPVRAHHCKSCHTCVLRKDYHCVFIGNCVGLYNHKQFILFLCYGSAILTMSWVALLYDQCVDGPASRNLQGGLFGLYVFGEVSAFFVSLYFIYFLGIQIQNIRQGVTTLQSFKAGLSSSGVFNRGGFFQNFQQIMGKRQIWNPFKKNI